jgi:hypothetical protein
MWNVLKAKVGRAVITELAICNLPAWLRKLKVATSLLSYLVTRGEKSMAFGARHQLATAIKDIKDQVHEVANRDGRYRGPHGVVASLTGVATTRVTTTVDPHLIALYGAQKNIVGIADAKAEVMKKLFEGDDVSRKQLKILSIVGFGNWWIG